MIKPYLFTHGGITLDLSQVKAFHLDGYSPRGRTHILRIEFKARYEFIRNPQTGEYEKVLINDFTEHAYADYATADAHRDEWQGYWQDYLEEHS